MLWRIRLKLMDLTLYGFAEIAEKI